MARNPITYQREYQRKWAKKERLRRKKSGQCTQPSCPNMADEKHVFCFEHLRAGRERCKNSAIKNPKGRMLVHAKYRAKRRKTPFNIRGADISIPEVCPVLGIPLQRGYGVGGALANSPSLDCFIPDLGYVPNNVFVISQRANMLKGNGTAVEHERIAAWMRKVAKNA